MKPILTLATMILFCVNSYAQQFKEMTIFKTDNSQTKANGKFVYQNDFINAISFENSNLSIENIAKVIIDETTYLAKDYEGNRYLFLQIVNGEVSMFRSKNKYFLENAKFGLKELAKNEYSSYPVFKPGTISPFINNCKLAVNTLQDNVTNLTLKNLKTIINIYNSCNLDSEIQIADEVIAEAMKPKEKIQFGASLGLMNLKTDYSNIMNIPTSNLNLKSVGAKVYFHSNMLDRNLDFNISVDYFLEGKQKIKNSEYTLYSNTQFIKSMIGANYIFNTISEKIKPYIGFSGGMIFNSNSSIILISSNQQPSKRYKANNELTYNINTGAVFKILNQTFDFLIEYQPNLDVSLLNSEDLSTEKRSYNLSGINFRLTYIF